MEPVPRPVLRRGCVDGIRSWTDSYLRRHSGILVAFTERGGGVSRPPFDGLNLAHHVGDDPTAVDLNRTRLMDALGLDGLSARIVTAEQVHGTSVAVVGDAEAGAGAHAPGTGLPPIPGIDALVTLDEDVPLMLFFADCVPVILVAREPVRSIGVAHAGWRGAAAKIHVAMAERLCRIGGCRPSDLLAYIGPYIDSADYEVGEEVLARFGVASDTIAAAPGHLDLGALVSADLERIGVPKNNLVALGSYTAGNSDRFYSYRAAPLTGRHAAVAAILWRQG